MRVRHHGHQGMFWWMVYSCLYHRFVVMVAGQAFLPVLHFSGTVLNDQGNPLQGAKVQFWQTDHNGNYNHPQSVPQHGITELLTDFQYFGTATTSDDGTFEFLTYRPGLYTQRPITHIHYKVWWENQALLTSQFYFRDEGFTQYPDALQLDLIHPEDGYFVYTNKTIVVNLGLGGSVPLTPFQQEGPYYPAIDFFDMDSDMTNVTRQETFVVFSGGIDIGNDNSNGNTNELVPSQAPSQSPTSSPSELSSTWNESSFSNESLSTYYPTDQATSSLTEFSSFSTEQQQQQESNDGTTSLDASSSASLAGKRILWSIWMVASSLVVVMGCYL